ncbi:hypothetical protein BJF88_01030 [Cellulosimicrobium sp. CUA-896]|nr:hypothetical protein BJF88_01030 [Cellulosimicrobium sp. CUA-896]
MNRASTWSAALMNSCQRSCQPAPSNEKRTNCGGCSPGARRVRGTLVSARGGAVGAGAGGGGGADVGAGASPVSAAVTAPAPGDIPGARAGVGVHAPTASATPAVTRTAPTRRRPGRARPRACRGTRGRVPSCPDLLVLVASIDGSSARHPSRSRRRRPHASEAGAGGRGAWPGVS